MKSKLLFLFFLGFMFNVNGQRNYAFDYMLEYQFQARENSKMGKHIILVNSQNASYVCYVYEKDNSNFQLVLMDQSGYGRDIIINKDVFYKSGVLILPCANRKYNKRIIDDEMFDFENVADTLISGISYKHYTVERHNKKEARMYNDGKSHVVLENNTGIEKPIFILLDMFEQTQQAIKIIPNGIPKESYSLTYKGAHKKFIYNLSHYEKIDLEMVIPIDCFVDKGLESNVKKP